MKTLSPTIQFQTAHKAEAESLTVAVRERWMAVSLTHAIASMSIGGATKEELIGARKFVEIFLNLAEPVKAAPMGLPPKELGQKPEEKQEA